MALMNSQVEGSQLFVKTARQAEQQFLVYCSSDILHAKSTNNAKEQMNALILVFVSLGKRKSLNPSTFNALFLLFCDMLLQNLQVPFP